MFELAALRAGPAHLTLGRSCLSVGGKVDAAMSALGRWAPGAFRAWEVLVGCGEGDTPGACRRGCSGPSVLI